MSSAEEFATAFGPQSELPLRWGEQTSAFGDSVSVSRPDPASGSPVEENDDEMDSNNDGGAVSASGSGPVRLSRAPSTKVAAATVEQELGDLGESVWLTGLPLPALVPGHVMPRHEASVGGAAGATSPVLETHAKEEADWLRTGGLLLDDEGDGDDDDASAGVPPKIGAAGSFGVSFGRVGSHGLRPVSNPTGAADHGDVESDEENGGEAADASLVLFEERLVFARALLDAAVAAREAPAACVAAGLGRMLPLSLLRLFRWDQLQRAVCGIESIDVQMLRRHTKYLYCSDGDSSVNDFWAVLDSFTQE